MLGDHNAISIVHTALLQCPDEAPFSESSILKFVDDAELRGSLLIDLHAVQVNLHEGSWKPATVLAGSVIEALLLWAITRLPEILKTRAEALSGKVWEPWVRSLWKRSSLQKTWRLPWSSHKTFET